MKQGWKKLVALAVLALFIVSMVPAALAKDEGESSGKGSGKEVVSTPAEEIEKEMVEQAGEEGTEGTGPGVPGIVPGLPLAQEELEKIKEKQQEKLEKLREKQEKAAEKLAEKLEKNQEKLAKVQEKLQEEQRKIEEKWLEQREKFLEEKVKFEEKRKEFLEKQAELEELKERAKCREDTEECKARKLELKLGVKQHLAKTIDLIESSLLKLQAKVEASKVLTEEEKQSALARIEELEQRLTAKREEVLALGDTVSGPELKQQVKELKKLWQEVRKEQRRILADLISNKGTNIVQGYEHFVEQMQERIAKLQEKGADPALLAELENLLAQFRSKVEEVQAAQQSARIAWRTAKESGTDGAVQTAREKQEEFKQAMKEARVALRELLMKYKELKHSVDIGEMEMQPGVPDAASPASPPIAPLEPVAGAEVPAGSENPAEIPTSVPTPLPTPQE